MLNKILIVTSSYDLTVDYIIEKYGEEHNFFRMNTDKLSEYEVCVHNYNDFWEIKDKYGEIQSNKLKAVYYRKPVLPDLGAYEPHYHNLMAKEILTLIEGIVESCDRRCLSKPSVLKRADNKILQLKLAKEVGFV